MKLHALLEADLDDMMDSYDDADPNSPIVAITKFFDDMKHQVGKHGITSYTGATSNGSSSTEDQMIQSMARHAVHELIHFAFKIGKKELTIRVGFTNEDNKVEIKTIGGVMKVSKNGYFTSIVPKGTDAKLNTADKSVAYMVVALRHEQEREDLKTRHAAELKALSK